MVDASPGDGPRLLWIGLRTAHRVPVRVVNEAVAQAGRGLAGDHAVKGRSTLRQLTLISADDLRTLSNRLGEPVEPMLLRRNLLVECHGASLTRGESYRLGEMTFIVTGPCEPCSRIREVLGPDGFKAMRAHGGVTARIVQGGRLRCGDALMQLQSDLFR